MANGRGWEEWEDGELTRIYPDYGTDGVLLALPHRSRKALWQRAAELGLKRRGPYRVSCPWSEIEDGLIRRLYPDGGADAVKVHCPNRTHAAITSRAKRIGVPHHRSDMVAELYPVEDLDAWRALQATRLPVYELARFGVPSIGVAA